MSGEYILKFYTISFDSSQKNEVFTTLKNNEYFKWVKYPNSFTFDTNDGSNDYEIFFTMYGLNKFIDNDFEKFKLEYGEPYIDIKYIDTKDSGILYSNNHIIIHKRA